MGFASSLISLVSFNTPCHLPIFLILFCLFYYYYYYFFCLFYCLHLQSFVAFVFVYFHSTSETKQRLRAEKMAISTTAAVHIVAETSPFTSTKLAHFSSLQFPTELRISQFSNRCLKSRTRRPTLTPVITCVFVSICVCMCACCV